MALAARAERAAGDDRDFLLVQQALAELLGGESGGFNGREDIERALRLEAVESHRAELAEQEAAAQVVLVAHSCDVVIARALARNYGIDKPFFFNRKEAKDHGEGGNIVGYKPQDGDRVIIIEDVITAGTAIRETMPVLKGCADVKVTDMFISVNRCEVGQNPGKTAVMEVGEEFGIKVHALVTVQDIREYLADKAEYAHLLPLMDAYMAQYCVF